MMKARHLAVRRTHHSDWGGAHHYLCIRNHVERVMGVRVLHGEVFIRLAWRPTREYNDFHDMVEEWGWLLDQENDPDEEHPEM